MTDANHHSGTFLTAAKRRSIHGNLRTVSLQNHSEQG